jgi:phage gp16-like protein
MDSFTKFNKAYLGFYNDIIGDFSKKVKESIPEEFHSAIDELMVSNQKVNNKMKKKTIPTKKKALSGWNLFYKENQSSVEATKQKNKMSLVSDIWKALSDEEREVWKNKAKSLSGEPTSDSADTGWTEEEKAKAKEVLGLAFWKGKKAKAKKSPKTAGDAYN